MPFWVRGLAASIYRIITVLCLSDPSDTAHASVLMGVLPF
jgi:hypothetical protein